MKFSFLFIFHTISITISISISPPKTHFENALLNLIKILSPAAHYKEGALTRLLTIVMSILQVVYSGGGQCF